MIAWITHKTGNSVLFAEVDYAVRFLICKNRIDLGIVFAKDMNKRNKPKVARN